MPAPARRPPGRPSGGDGDGALPAIRRHLFWAAGCFAAVASQASAQSDATSSPWHFQLFGVCDDRSYLDAAVFDRVGMTANGSPFFKAQGQEAYIYYDANCAGLVDGKEKARWILDDSRPDTTRMMDLDGDGNCNYTARVNWDDGSRPPYTQEWLMMCGGKWASVHLAFQLITTTSTTLTSTSTTVTSTTATTTTVTTSTETTTTGTETSTTQTTTSTTETTTTTARWFAVSGACEHKDFLNDLVFVERGETANGAPWFESLSAPGQQPWQPSQYVYYDLDCNGGGNGVARWIIDASAPNQSREEDVDNDSSCNYHARIDSTDSSFPPAAGEWHMFCGTEWQRGIINMSSADPSLLEDFFPKPEAESMPDGMPEPTTPDPEATQTNDERATTPEHSESAHATTEAPVSEHPIENASSNEKGPLDGSLSSGAGPHAAAGALAVASAAASLALAC